MASTSTINATAATKLTRRIRAHPDDTGAYLAYADLLQQRGDPRGEFIRLCHHAADGNTPELLRARQDYLQVWSTKLLGKLNSAWASGAIECDWRLGFFESLRVRPGAGVPEILKHLPGNASARYIRRLDLSGTDITELPASLSRLTTLRELDISDSAISRIPAAFGRLKLDCLVAGGCDIALAPHAMYPLLLASGARSLPWADALGVPEDVEMDENGFLVNPSDWSPAIAVALAAVDDLELTAEHWKVLLFLRAYYDDYQILPAVRAITKAMGMGSVAGIGGTGYLQQLFPQRAVVEGLVWQPARIAGLPAPVC